MSSTHSNKNSITKFIEVYMQHVNSVRTLQVVDGLLDVECDETTIKSLLAGLVMMYFSATTSV